MVLIRKKDERCARGLQGAWEELLPKFYPTRCPMIPAPFQPRLVSLPSLEARPEILTLSSARSPAGLGRRISRPHSPRGRRPASGLIAGFFEPWDSA